MHPCFYNNYSNKWTIAARIYKIDVLIVRYNDANTQFEDNKMTEITQKTDRAFDCESGFEEI